MRAPHVFTISPALPFLDTFVAALVGGKILDGLAADAAPLALADTTIYVPTRRSAQALSEAFLAHAKGDAIGLPRILPLGALEATETSLLLTEQTPEDLGLPLPAAASQLWRRLHLATLIQRWAMAIEGALRRVDASGAPVVDPAESFRVATSSVDAFALAGDLAGLIDEMAIEDVAWRELDTLEMAGFDDYWRITTDFLSIAISVWPQVLAETGLVDPATRQIALANAQAQRLAAGRCGPVIAIGSTGTNKATARLLAAIARAPNGAVVLPGLDLDLDDEAWRLISGKADGDRDPSFGHPQAALARLLPTLGITRAEVRPLGEPDATRKLRARVVSEALRPADTTEEWRRFRKAHPPKILVPALDGISLIEAADEREEALCLAVAMRELLETPDRTAALVTPDRELARRVRGELLRWNIEVDDSGGESLAVRPLGILARLVSTAGARPLTASALSGLFAHPLATFGLPRADVTRLGRLIEIAVLRIVPIGGRDTDTIFHDARALAQDRHAHRAQKAITPGDWEAMAALWTAATHALEPLVTLQGSAPLAARIEAHRACLAAVADSADPDEIETLDVLFDDLAESADTAPAFSAPDYDVFFGRLLRDVMLRNTSRPHPRLQILGLLEARLIEADVMLLGGLDESIWPPAAHTDPFLNRPMRQALGLTPPERRLGQTAHDFEMALGASRVVLSRATKRAGSPTVASRFLLRLEALCGDAWKACRMRGAATLEAARMLDQTRKQPVPVKRPQPTPPVDLRPQRLSVTQIETLRRDPYAIYAAHILRIAPLTRIGAEIDAGEFGNIMHQALHDFARDATLDETVADRRSRLDAILRAAFETSLADPAFAALRWPVVQKAAEVFLRFDTKQRRTASRILTEIDGQLDLALADQTSFRLTARADRIDLHRDASATLIDYKTGQPPGNREVAVGFAPQLTLEAAILQGGGFPLQADGAVGAVYLKLGGKDGGAVRDVKFETEPFQAVVDRHLDGLVRLMSAFRNEATAYPSRPFPKYAKRYSDYDHLARVREWSLAGEDELPP